MWYVAAERHGGGTFRYLSWGGSRALRFADDCSASNVCFRVFMVSILTPLTHAYECTWLLGTHAHLWFMRKRAEVCGFVKVGLFLPLVVVTPHESRRWPKHLLFKRRWRPPSLRQTDRRTGLRLSSCFSCLPPQPPTSMTADDSRRVQRCDACGKRLRATGQGAGTAGGDEGKRFGEQRLPALAAEGCSCRACHIF